MILTSQQEKAISISKEAYLNSEPLTIIAGYAGTGKTVVVTKIIEALGLKLDEVAFVTFTGKASLVLQQRGIPAKTIHSTFYTVVRNKQGELIQLPKKELDESYSLIVIDEISMVSMDLIKTILKHRIPVIGLGDPGQLPPIGEDNRLLQRPNIFLDQIMRQAEENPIIKLSMDIRDGKPLVLQKNSNVQVIKRSEVVDGMFHWADQILCGYNNTRKSLNKTIRESLGREDYFSPEKEDKIIILKNYWEKFSEEGTPLVNGTTGNIVRIKDKTSKNIYMNFKTDFNGEEFKNIVGNLCNITGETRPAPNKYQKNNLIEFDYGYAITTHKSQGSQYNNLLVFEEVLNRDFHSRWLYTACTRAIDKLVIVKG